MYFVLLQQHNSDQDPIATVLPNRTKSHSRSGKKKGSKINQVGQFLLSKQLEAAKSSNEVKPTVDDSLPGLTSPPSPLDSNQSSRDKTFDQDIDSDMETDLSGPRVEREQPVPVYGMKVHVKSENGGGGRHQNKQFQEYDLRTSTPRSHVGARYVGINGMYKDRLSPLAGDIYVVHDSPAIIHTQEIPKAHSKVACNNNHCGPSHTLKCTGHFVNGHGPYSHLRSPNGVKGSGHGRTLCAKGSMLITSEGQYPLLKLSHYGSSSPPTIIETTPSSIIYQDEPYGIVKGTPSPKLAIAENCKKVRLKSHLTFG